MVTTKRNPNPKPRRRRLTSEPSILNEPSESVTPDAGNSPFSNSPYSNALYSTSRPLTAESARHAGFWKRVWASLIDIAWQIPLVLALGLIVFGRSYFTVDSGVYNGLADFIVTNVVPAVAVLTFWLYRQATPGKMLTGIKIVDAKTYGKPRFFQYVLRYIGYIPSTMLLGLGLLWVAIDKRHQGWHDKIAGTVVIYTDDI